MELEPEEEENGLTGGASSSAATPIPELEADFEPKPKKTKGKGKSKGKRKVAEIYTDSEPDDILGDLVDKQQESNISTELLALSGTPERPKARKRRCSWLEA